MKSYYAILVGAMRGSEFENRAQLFTWLEQFLAYYNYRRLHSFIVKLLPMTFWDQWKKGNIEVIEHPKIRLKLKVPRV